MKATRTAEGSAARSGDRWGLLGSGCCWGQRPSLPHSGPATERGFIDENRTRRQEAEQPRITTSLKVDKETYMKIVTDVKQELRKANALKINYSTGRGR